MTDASKERVFIVLRGTLQRLVIGFVVAVVILLAVEGGARLLPLDRWEEKQPNVSYPVFVRGAGESLGQYVTNPHFIGAMSEQHFAVEKPIGVKRIFVLGGSAALGWPGPPPAAFTGYMQRALNAVAPGRYEVVNACAMSYGSHRVVDVLTDVLLLEPDLVLIWSGNNEYVERNVLTPFARGAKGRGLQRVLRHSALYRTVRLALLKTAPDLFVRPDGEDITDPRSVPKVRRGMLGRTTETDRQVLDNYRTNLAAMADMLRKAKIPGFFCTVPVNLADWVPVNAPPRLEPGVVTEQWETVRQTAFSAWEQSRYTEAVAKLLTLLQMTPDYAFAHYLLGDSYLNLGKEAEAHAAFETARTLDLRPVRALPVFEESIRTVAAEEGMGLVELEAAFLKASPKGVPGLDLFLDYVHPNESGHKLAAVTVLSALPPQFAPPVPIATLVEIVLKDDWLQRNGGGLAEYEYALGLTLFNNGKLAAAEQAYLRALEMDPEFPEPAGNLGVIYERWGDYAKALEYYRRASRFDPDSVHVIPLAKLLYLMGNQSEAREIAERVYRQGVVSVNLFLLLGEISLTDGRLSEAINYFNEALAAGGSDPSIYRGLGNSYRRMGDEANALEAFRRAEVVPR